MSVDNTAENRIYRLMDELDEIPELIKEALEAADKYSEEITKQEETLRHTKTRVEYEVSVLTDDDGKKLFSNQTARDAESYKRLSNDEEYQQLSQQVEDTKSALSKVRGDIEYYKYRFRAAQAKTELEGVLQSRKALLQATPLTGEKNE